jgi:HlyD family secretion protein
LTSHELTAAGKELVSMKTEARPMTFGANRHDMTTVVRPWCRRETSNLTRQCDRRRGSGCGPRLEHAHPIRALGTLAALVAFMAATAGCNQSTEVKADQASGPAVPRVEAVKPERATIRRSTEQPGQIEAFEVTAIYAKVSGYVEKWTVDIGTKVKKNQVLAVLSVPELDAEAEQKQAMIEESEAQRLQAQASEDVARANLAAAAAKLTEVRAGTARADADLARWQSEFKRIEQLFKEHAQTGSLVDETRSKLRASESTREEVYAQVKSAEAAVRQTEAMLEKARADTTAATASIKVARSDARRVQALRQFATIVAPYDGVITRRHVDAGDLTEPGNHGEPLFIVARDDVVRITVSVPEMFATEVDPGDRVLIRLQAASGRIVEAKVTRNSWALDDKNRTLRTEIDVPNPSGVLRPGLYAYATIVVEEHANVLSVPTSALVRQESNTFCVAVQGGQAVRKPVKIGLDDGSRAEILSGLNGDEHIIKAYASSLSDGQHVEILPPPK